MRGSGQVLDGVEGQQILGKYDSFYVAGLEDADQTDYSVAGLGRIFYDLETGVVLGRQAEVLGSVRVLKFGDPASLDLISSRPDIMPGDRLLVAKDPMQRT